jgi:hypothetical protein
MQIIGIVRCAAWKPNPPKYQDTDQDEDGTCEQ